MVTVLKIIMLIYTYEKMEKFKNSDNVLSWKLVWDAETKDVLLLKQIDSDIETVNELFEAKNINDIYNKIKELELKYNPFKLQEEEWT